MEIIAHRGIWKSEGERNSEKAFRKSLQMGYGTETDFRDLNQQLKISHNMADNNCMDADPFFKLYCGTAYTLALNIKADGIQIPLKKLLDKYDISNYFCFDMSVPDTFGYIDQKIRFFTRESEYEMKPALLKEADGIWLDGFISDTWITQGKIENYLGMGKKVCIVSPDLHGREYRNVWKRYKEMECCKDNRLILCTNYPEEGSAYFNGKN